MSNIPEDWDQIRSGGLPGEIHGRETVAPPPPIVLRLEAAWAELVTVLAVVIVAIVVLLGFGYQPSLIALPWTGALAVSWWALAATVSLLVRQATPGMLLAGLTFAHDVRPRRLPWVVVVAFALLITLGFPELISRRHAILARAADVEIISATD